MLLSSLFKWFALSTHPIAMQDGLHYETFKNHLSTSLNRNIFVLNMILYSYVYMFILNDLLFNVKTNLFISLLFLNFQFIFQRAKKNIPLSQDKKFAFHQTYVTLIMNVWSCKKETTQVNTPITPQLDKKSIQSVSKIFKIISDPTRISILFLLQQQELSVGSITTSLEMEQSAISHQLRTLKEARLVKARREGKAIFYSLDDPHVVHILEQVLDHVREIAE